MEKQNDNKAMTLNTQEKMKQDNDEGESFERLLASMNSTLSFMENRIHSEKNNVLSSTSPVKDSGADLQENEDDDDSPSKNRGVTAILESIASDRRLMSIRIKQENDAAQKKHAKNTFGEDQEVFNAEEEDPILNTILEIAGTPEESTMEVNAVEDPKLTSILEIAAPPEESTTEVNAVEDPKLTSILEIAATPQESKTEVNAVSRDTLDIERYFDSTNFQKKKKRKRVRKQKKQGVILHQKEF